jgi:NADP-dependent aldehyde dehydrogenase
LLDPDFLCADSPCIDAAARAAQAAFESERELPRAPTDRAAFLDSIAAELDAAHDAILSRAHLETGLASARLVREFQRMVGTLRMFAHVVRDGSWVSATIDTPGSADAQAGLPPGPDIRSMLVPLGPVAVFGAGNFPLAYGVAGGDVASALAAGCPVVAKAHPGHPGTCELIARAVIRALERSGLDAGLFSFLQCGGQHEHEVGRELVLHPAIRAVGFTGSFAGGMALDALARSRPIPIPVFAEMGSVNPIFILPAAAAARPQEIAEKLSASILDSSGQQCTCPGLIFLVAGTPRAGRSLAEELARRIESAGRCIMLSPRVATNYRRRLGEAAAVPGVEASTRAHDAAGAPPPAPARPVVAGAALLRNTYATYRASPTLREEIFGPGAIIVECADEAELADAARTMPGSLTASIFADPSDEKLRARLLPLLERAAGRLIFDGVPTGVRVCAAMQHGGPFPATNRPDTTAVGARAILRWCRPVCYQNAPQAVLPPALRDHNPLRLRRLDSGRWVDPAGPAP